MENICRNQGSDRKRGTGGSDDVSDRRKADLYSGEDGIVVPLMAIGAVGVISVWSNIAPKDVHEMCAAFAAGDVARAMQMQLAAQPLIDALFVR